MTFQLPMDDMIVPASVLRGYLANYKDTAFLQTIEAVYQKKIKALSKITDAPTPGASVFILVAGTHGVGKSNLVQNLIKQDSKQYTVCDVDSILSDFPEFQARMEDIPSRLQEDFYKGGMHAYNTDKHRKLVEDITEYYRPAAKYISDRLMTHCVREGYPVIFETNAKTPELKNFLRSVKAAGAVLETHICQAPLTIKQAGFEARFNIAHDIGISDGQIKSEHDAMIKNMKVIAEESSNLKIHWRQDVNKPLMDTGIDPIAAAGFDAYFMDRDMTIASLMALRPATRKPAPAGMTLQVA